MCKIEGFFFSEMSLHKPAGLDKLHAPLEAKRQTDVSGRPGFKRTHIDFNSTLLIYMKGLKIFSSRPELRRQWWKQAWLIPRALPWAGGDPSTRKHTNLCFAALRSFSSLLAEPLLWLRKWRHGLTWAEWRLLCSPRRVVSRRPAGPQPVNLGKRWRFKSSRRADPHCGVTLVSVVITEQPKNRPSL